MSSSTSSGCAMVSEWLNMCREDFIAVVVVTFFVVYVVWGIRFTVFVYKWCKRKVTGRPRDMECGELADLDTEVEFKDQDPYHSPTLMLKDFLARSAYTDIAVPPMSYTPGLTQTPQRASLASSRFSSSSTLRSPEDTAHQTKLESFRFPGQPRSSSPTPSSGRLASAGRSSKLLEDFDLGILDEIALDSPVKPKTSGNLKRSSGLRSSNVPPPALLDLDREMEPERFEYED